MTTERTVERVQFNLAREDVEGEAGENVFKRFERTDHPQWPRLHGEKSAVWGRVALRVLHAFHARGSGQDWLVVRGRKSGAPLALKTTLAMSKAKVDVNLGEADSERLAKLAAAISPNSKPAVLRAAVHFLAAICDGLADGGQLMAKDASEQTPIPLSEIASDKAPPKGGWALPVPVGGLIASSVTERSGPRAPDAPKLFAIIWFITTFNRWLAMRVAALTHAAMTSNEPDASWGVDAESCDLHWLLNRFWEIELARGERGNLFAELENHQLLPAWWAARARADFRVPARFGKVAVARYLNARARAARPWRALEIVEGAPYPMPWRGWTRSRGLQHEGESYREIAAPIEWAAVLHHELLRTERGSEATAAHDLQSWLREAFSIEDEYTHSAAIMGACTQFNAEFYGRSALLAGHVQTASEKAVSLKRLLAVLTAKDVSIAHDDWPRFLYLWLNILRVVAPVYRWADGPASKKLDASRPVLSPQRRDSDADADDYADPEIEVDPEPEDEPDDGLHVKFDNVELLFRAVTHAAASELKARIFGAQVAIDGLRAILHGGVTPPGTYSKSWLIYGPPGSGKSTFALHVATDMARRGRTSILVCSEERAEAVLERLHMFGLADSARYDIITRGQFEAMLKDGKPSDDELGDSRGLLVLFGLSAQADGSRTETIALSSWLEHVATRRREFCRELAAREKALEGKPGDRVLGAALRCRQRRWRFMSLVIDSVDSIAVESLGAARATGAADGDRAAMTSLIQTIEDSGVWGLLLCGANNVHKEPLSYLADTVVEFGIDPASMQRRLTIQKCRAQPYDPGHHELRLVEAAGVVVHPNLASTQRAARLRARPSMDSEHLIPIPERIHWQAQAAGSDSGEASSGPQQHPLPADAALRKVSPRRGGWLLLYGASQSGKWPFLCNLLCRRAQLKSYPNWQLGATGGVLLVSFRGSEQEFLRPLRASPRLSELWRTNVSDIQLHWYGVDERLSAGRIIGEIVARIQRARRDGLPLEWIVFLDVEAISANLPAVHAEASFWPTVLAVTGSERISTAFVVNDADGSGRFVSQHRQDMDYVFKFASAGDDKTLSIEKSADPPPDGYPTLHFDLRGSPVCYRPATSGQHIVGGRTLRDAE